MILYNKSKEILIQDDIRTAYTFWKRLKGLLYTKRFPKWGGLAIKPCSGIHTFFMQYPIDVILLDQEDKVIYKERSISPYKFTPLFKKAKMAIELPKDSLLKIEIDLGDELLLLAENKYNKNSTAD